MSDPETSSEESVLYYFIDEAGDPVLFDRRGKKVPVGTGNCSRFFMLGKLEVADPSRLASELDRLRTDLLADPYFRDVPSMQP